MSERRSMASFTKEVNPRLAKRSLKMIDRLANHGLTSAVKRGHWRGFDITIE